MVPPDPVDDPVAAAKAALRTTVKARRDALSPATRAALSTSITTRLLALDSYRAATTVLAYMPFGSEFDTRALIQHALTQGKTLLLPRVDRGSRALTLHLVNDLERDLQPGVWGIPEPKPACQVVEQPFDFKWILVPGLAFTSDGKRLGYGAGYYDRLIACCTQQPALVAAAFSAQMADDIPCTPTDQRVELVVTEDAAYYASH
jgi:5-formyltetrahydrofolate cyclo-ligase